jgi:hypothetical protein
MDDALDALQEAQGPPPPASIHVDSGDDTVTIWRDGYADFDPANRRDSLEWPIARLDELIALLQAHCT